MSPSAAIMLEKQIYPIIRNTIPRTARPIGSEDSQELIQDATASAAEMIESMEKSGRKPLPNSIAYYKTISFLTEMALVSHTVQCDVHNSAAGYIRGSIRRYWPRNNAQLVKTECGNRQDPAGSSLHRTCDPDADIVMKTATT